MNYLNIRTESCTRISMTIEEAKARCLKVINGVEAQIEDAKLVRAKNAISGASVHDLNAATDCLENYQYSILHQSDNWTISNWIAKEENIKTWRCRLALLSGGATPSEAYMKSRTLDGPHPWEY